MVGKGKMLRECLWKCGVLGEEGTAKCGNGKLAGFTFMSNHLMVLSDFRWFPV